MGQCFDISGAMRTHQLKLADRQCSMIDLSQRIQDAVVILSTSLYAARQSDELTQRAAEVVCGHLWRKLIGQRPTNRDWRKVTSLGADIADSGWMELDGVEADDIMMKYRS